MEQRTADERIEGLREEIDRIDAELIALFERRMDTAREIGRIKRENCMGIKNTDREAQVKANCRKNCKNSLYIAYAESVMMSMIDASCALQKADAAGQDVPSET